MHNIQPLIDAVLLLLATVVVVPLCLRLKASPVLGYLVGGMAIGPYGFGIVANVEATQALAEFGVVFLLFTVGLELSLNRLKVMRRLVFGLGAAQVIVTGVAIGLAALYALGDDREAVVIGGAFALSSTAIVIQLLRERHEFSTRSGRTVFAVLLFQDLAVVPLIVLIPLLAADSDTGMGLALAGAGLRAVVAIVAILVIGKLVLKPLFHHAATAHRTPELFTAVVLLVVLGMSLLTLEAGLSMALGAFLGGLLLSETEFRHQVEADIAPFSGLLLGLFFITVGMTIDVGLVVELWRDVLWLTAAVIIGKGVVLSVLARLFGVPWAQALRVGLILSQVGEFAFVLFALAMATDVLDRSLGQLLLVVVSITMVLTPFLTALGKYVADRLDPPVESKETGNPGEGTGVAAPNAEPEIDDRPVLIAGFGRVGETVARQLWRLSVPYVALDNRPERVSRGREAGFAVYYGNGAHADVMRAAGVDRARAVVLTIDDLAAATQIVERLRKSHPDLPIFARARNGRHRRQLKAMGVVEAVPETLESSLQLGASVLRAIGQPAARIDTVVSDLRESGDDLDDSHAPAGTETGPGKEPAGRLSISRTTLLKGVGRLMRLGREGGA